MGLWGLADRSGRHVYALLLLAAMLGMTLLQALNAQTFQRYFDPWALLALGWLAAMAMGRGAAKDSLILGGMAVLAVVQAAGSVAGVLRPAFMGPALPPW